VTLLAERWLDEWLCSGRSGAPLRSADQQPPRFRNAPRQGIFGIEGRSIRRANNNRHTFIHNHSTTTTTTTTTNRATATIKQYPHRLENQTINNPAISWYNR